MRIAGTSVERLNGKVATVEGFMGERVNVKLDDEANLVALKPAVLAVAEERGAKRGGGGGDGSKKVTVECNGVKLKLTLTAKQLEKPFSDAVLKPFLAAYSKKQVPPIEPALSADSVAQVTVDSEGQKQLSEIKMLHL